jgi:hypothetical protein
MAPRILTSQLHTGDRSASRPRAALPQEKEPRHPLDKGLGGPQSRSGRRGGNKNPSTCQELKPSRSGRSLVTIRTELSRLFHSKKTTNYSLLTVQRLNVKHLSLFSSDTNYIRFNIGKCFQRRHLVDSIAAVKRA